MLSFIKAEPQEIYIKMGSGENDSEAGKEDWLLYFIFYLSGCPGPSPLKRTECHRLRLMMSHSQSSDFPEPDS